jgi:AcrR family transcriptional regulator
MSSDGAAAGMFAGGKREQNASRNRAAILRAAREAFCEIGFGATTVRDIIRRTDLATGTFYNYFPDKEALLHELIEEFQVELRRRVHEAREAADTLEDLLRSAFRACFELFVEDEMIVTLLNRNAGEIEQLMTVRALDPAADDLANDLRSKASEGVIPSMDFELISHAAVAIGSELAFRHVRTRADVESATDFASELFLGGIERMSRRS